jgi:hypothetical protein
MVRCRILNFKNFDFILRVKKYSVEPLLLARYVSWTSSFMARDFSSPYGKISRRAVNLMTSMQNKNLCFSPCRNWLKINCLYSGWRIYSTARDFYLTGKKSLAMRELVQDTYRARSEAANPILFRF